MEPSRRGRKDSSKGPAYNLSCPSSWQNSEITSGVNGGYGGRERSRTVVFFFTKVRESIYRIAQSQTIAGRRRLCAEISVSSFNPFEHAACEKVELHRRTYVRIHVQGESMRSMQVRANMKVKLGCLCVGRHAAGIFPLWASFFSPLFLFASIYFSGAADAAPVLRIDDFVASTWTILCRGGEGRTRKTQVQGIY